MTTTAEPTTPEPTIRNTTIDPTRDPTKDPTHDPTKKPTIDSITTTPEPITSAPTTMEPTTDKPTTRNTTIDPTNDPTNNPTIDTTYDPTQEPTTANPTRYKPITPAPITYYPTIEETNDPTKNPTIDPMDEPTNDPTNDPTTKTTNDITTKPTLIPSNQPTSSQAWFGTNGFPLSTTIILSDPYGRVEASITITVTDYDDSSGIIALCTKCFLWQYRLQTTDASWITIDSDNNDYASVHNKVIQNNHDGIIIYESRLTVQSSRRMHSGYCWDENDASIIFIHGQKYDLRVRFQVNNGINSILLTSNALSITTNTLPSRRSCTISNVKHVQPLNPYNISCDELNIAENETNLEYNIVKEGVLMNRSFVSDLNELQSIAPLGDITMILLIKYKNIENAIACYPIAASFKTLNESTKTVDDILLGIEVMIVMISFAERPDIAIAVIIVVQDLYQQKWITKSEAIVLIGDIMDNIINTSHITSGSDIITELSIIETITSYYELIDINLITDSLESIYLAEIFETIDNFMRYTDEISAKQSVIQGELYMIAIELQQIIDNLEEILAILNSTDNELSESLIEYATFAAAKALFESNPSESFKYNMYKKRIVATKFDGNMIDFNASSIDKNSIKPPTCGRNDKYIAFPLAFWIEFNGFFDCVILSSSRYNLVSKQQQNKSAQSDMITINIYTEIERKRRRLQETINNYYSDKCNPYLIIINLIDSSAYDADHMTLNEESAFPSCEYWNVTSSLWQNEGCFVYNLTTNNTIAYSCSHLSTFAVFDDKVIPQINVLTHVQMKQLTMNNLLRYPTIWLTFLISFIIFVVLCFINPRLRHIQSKSVIAFHDVIYKSVQNEYLWQDIAGLELKYMTQFMPNKHLLGLGIKQMSSHAKCAICRLQIKLFTCYLRNDHMLLSICQRTTGTNFSLQQRLACFCMYSCTVMFLTGVFYGIEQTNIIKDIIASFIISLGATLPIFCVRKLFEKSAPQQVKSSKHVIETELDYHDVDYVDEDEGETSGFRKSTTLIKSTALWNDCDLISFVLERDAKNLTISALSEHMHRYYDGSNDDKDKIRASNDIRKIVFDLMYPLPHICKKIAWMILILWSLAACVACIMYGLSFDLKVAQSNTNIDDNDSCSASSSSFFAQIEKQLNEEHVYETILKQRWRNSQSYAGSDTNSWLVSIAQSLIVSLLLWQPFNVYIITWIKIWMFTYNLKMSITPNNAYALCKLCCCCGDNRSSHNVAIAKRDRESVIVAAAAAYRDRPVDYISFLANRSWIIDDVQTSTELTQIQSETKTASRHFKKRAIPPSININAGTIAGQHMTLNTLSNDDDDGDDGELEELLEDLSV